MFSDSKHFKLVEIFNDLDMNDNIVFVAKKTQIKLEEIKNIKDRLKINNLKLSCIFLAK